MVTDGFCKLGPMSRGQHCEQEFTGLFATLRDSLWFHMRRF